MENKNNLSKVIRSLSFDALVADLAMFAIAISYFASHPFETYLSGDLFTAIIMTTVSVFFTYRYLYSLKMEKWAKTLEETGELEKIAEVEVDAETKALRKKKLAFIFIGLVSVVVLVGFGFSCLFV